MNISQLKIIESWMQRSVCWCILLHLLDNWWSCKLRPIEYKTSSLMCEWFYVYSVLIHHIANYLMNSSYDWQLNSWIPNVVCYDNTYCLLCAELLDQTITQGAKLNKAITIMIWGSAINTQSTLYIYMYMNVHKVYYTVYDCWLYQLLTILSNIIKFLLSSDKKSFIRF